MPGGSAAVSQAGAVGECAAPLKTCDTPPRYVPPQPKSAAPRLLLYGMSTEMRCGIESDARGEGKPLDRECDRREGVRARA